MRRFPKLKLFALSFLLTAGILLTVIYTHRQREDKFSVRQLRRLVGDSLYVTAQLQPDDVRLLKDRGIGTIVDIRPDGEDREQAPSSQISEAARKYGLDFHYIPVPHEGIPDSAVEALSKVLSHPATPTLLYCRTGRRAVRTYALVEASRVDGPDADAIIKTVSEAGFSADDLRDKINQRIASRASTPPPPKN